MAEGVEAERREIQGQEHLAEVGPVVARFQGVGGVGDQVVVLRHKALEGADNPHQLAADGDFAHGGGGLGRCDRQVVRPLVAVGEPDALDGFADVHHSGCDVHVLPLQAADFADAQAALQADEEPEVAEGEVLLQVSVEHFMLLPGEHGHRGLYSGGRREVDIEGGVWPRAGLLAVAENHFQDHQRVLNALPAQPGGQFLIYKRLDLRFPDGLLPGKER